MADWCLLAFASEPDFGDVGAFGEGGFCVFDSYGPPRPYVSKLTLIVEELLPAVTGL